MEGRLTNMMVRWKERPSKGGYHAMTLRLDKLKQVSVWTDDRIRELLQFCEDFQVKHPMLDDALDAAKCIILFNDLNKW